MRNALVTGVSRRAGIGFAIARRLEEAGAHVFTQGWTPHDRMPFGRWDEPDIHRTGDRFRRRLPPLGVGTLGPSWISD